jgi:hypothetical protein
MVIKKKKDVLISFVNVKALLFSIQYGHTSFSCVLQLEAILYAGKSLIVHIKVVFIWKFYFLYTSDVKAIKWPKLFQLINQQTKINIYISTQIIMTGYDRRKKKELQSCTLFWWQVINLKYHTTNKNKKQQITWTVSYKDRILQFQPDI